MVGIQGGSRAPGRPYLWSRTLRQIMADVYVVFSPLTNGPCTLHFGLKGILLLVLLRPCGQTPFRSSVADILGGSTEQASIRVWALRNVTLCPWPRIPTL